MAAACRTIAALEELESGVGRSVCDAGREVRMKEGGAEPAAQPALGEKGYRAMNAQVGRELSEPGRVVAVGGKGDYGISQSWSGEGNHFSGTSSTKTEIQYFRHYWKIPEKNQCCPILQEMTDKIFTKVLQTDLSRPSK